MMLMMSLNIAISLFGLLGNFITLTLVLKLNKKLGNYIEEQDVVRAIEEKLKQRETDYRSVLMSKLDEVQNIRFSSLHKVQGK